MVLINFFAKKLIEFIENNGISYVICTHLYPAETLTFLKKNNKNIHFILIATDYT
jgi:predicted ATP-grasp superfamily ATP-dependent carboligase